MVKEKIRINFDEERGQLFPEYQVLKLGMCVGIRQAGARRGPVASCRSLLRNRRDQTPGGRTWFNEAE